MEARQEAPQILPLRYSSHRQIVAANGGLACEVFSGAIGIEGADQLQELIVRAVNAHDDLVSFARFVLRGIKSGHVTNASFIDHDLDGENVEVETLSSYAEKVLAKAGAA